MPVRQWLRDAIVGAVLFVSCSYILVVNPAILKSAGIPGGHVLAATALVAAIGSFIMGAWARAPSVVAPGMGLNAFIAAFITTTQIPWQLVLSSVAVAYVCYVLFFILPGLRREMLDKIPPSIVDIITSSIGGLILASAFHLVLPGPPPCTPPESAQASAPAAPCGHCPIEFVTSFSAILKPPYTSTSLLFLLAAAVTIVAFFASLHWAHTLEESGRQRAARFVELLPGLVLLACVPITALLTIFVVGPGGPSLALSGDIAIQLIPFRDALSTNLNRFSFPSMAVLLITVFFVLIVDFSGSPFVLLRREVAEPEFSRRVHRGFITEAVAGLASVLLQSSPTICFSESTAARSLRAVRGLPAVICGCLFFLAFMSIMFFGAETSALLARIPELSIAPLLATIGVAISWDALKPGSAPTSPPATAPSPQGPLDGLQRLVPKSLALGGAFAGGLTIGIAAGIIIEFVFATARQQPASRDGFFIAITGMAVVAFSTMLWVFDCF